MDIYTQHIDGDQKTFDMMVSIFPVIYAHLGADLDSKFNAIYATKQEEKQDNNLCQFKLQMNINGSSHNNYLRVNTHTIGGKPAIPVQKIRYLHANSGRSDKHYIIAMNSGVDFYYSIDENGWLEWDEYFVKRIVEPTWIKSLQRFSEKREYRVYDVEKLEAKGLVYHFNSFTRKVTCGGKTIVDLSDKKLYKLYSEVHRSISRINTVRPDSKMSTLIYMDYEDCKGEMRYLVSVQGLARELIKNEPMKISSMADRIRKTVKAERIIPVGILNGKKVYVAAKKIDLEAALNTTTEYKANAEDRYKMTKRIKTWLVRHNWTGENKKWTDEERQLANLLKSNKKNNIK